MENKIRFFLFLALISYAATNEWNYLERGPYAWGSTFPSCNGQSQSPVNIDKSKVVYLSSLSPFILNKYKQSIKWSIENNGHAIQATQIDKQPTPYVEGGGLKMIYQLAGFHFHWNSYSTLSSEHSINSVYAPLELHIVHKSQNQSVAVLAFLFELSRTNNTALKPIISAIDQKGASKDLSSILPEDLEGYYRYTGSLTTPPCTEGVIWTIFSEKIKISDKQLEILKSQNITHNTRPVQNLNGRVIYTSEPISNEND